MASSSTPSWGRLVSNNEDNGNRHQLTPPSSFRSVWHSHSFEPRQFQQVLPMSNQLNAVNLHPTSESESSRVVPNSAFGSPNPLQLPITSQGQQINTTPMRPLMFQYLDRYSIMTGSVPPPRTSLSSLSEESSNVTRNATPPLTGQQINTTPMQPFMFQYLGPNSTTTGSVLPQRASLFILNEDSEYVINPNPITPSQYITTNARPPLREIDFGLVNDLRTSRGLGRGSRVGRRANRTIRGRSRGNRGRRSSQLLAGSSSRSGAETIANEDRAVGNMQSSQIEAPNAPNTASPAWRPGQSLPVMNGPYDPRYRDFGLPVDPYLRALVLNPSFLNGQANNRNQG